MQILLSADGETFDGPAVATGTFEDIAAQQTATFDAAPAKAVRLRMLTPAKASQPWASIGDLQLVGVAGTGGGGGGGGGEPDPPLPRGLWEIFASSEQRLDNLATNLIDADPDSIWHSKFRDGVAPLPHQVTVVFPRDADVSGLTYLPRQDGTGNGRIGDFEVLHVKRFLPEV